LARLEALAKQEQREAERRERRIADKNFDEFRRVATPIELDVTTMARNGSDGTPA
jgi:hypothetical protein